MAVRDAEGWVRNVERLYRAHDAEGVAALYTADATTRYGRLLMSPDWVHSHPRSWFDSLEDYRIRRAFRAASGDIIVSETTASYLWKPSAAPAMTGPDAEAEGAKVPGRRYREYGTDIYWVNDQGLIYHKHTMDMVEPHEPVQPMEPDH
jgi:nuclear transport factor 2 (NTF2) superfamily protein